MLESMNDTQAFPTTLPPARQFITQQNYQTSLSSRPRPSSPCSRRSRSRSSRSTSLFSVPTAIAASVQEDPNQLKTRLRQHAGGGRRGGGTGRGGGRGGDRHRRTQASPPQAAEAPQRSAARPSAPLRSHGWKMPEEVKNCAAHGERKLIGYDRQETLEFERPKLKVRVTLDSQVRLRRRPECGVKEAAAAGRPGRGQPLRHERGRRDHHRQIRLSPAHLSPAGLIRRQRLDAFAEHALEHPGGRRRRASALRALPARARWLPAACWARTRRGSRCSCRRRFPAVIPGDAKSQRIHEVFTEARAEGEPSVSGRMWAYRSLTVPINVFDFTVSRHRDGPDEFLVDGQLHRHDHGRLLCGLSRDRAAQRCADRARRLQRPCAAKDLSTRGPASPCWPAASWRCIRSCTTSRIAARRCRARTGRPCAPRKRGRCGSGCGNCWMAKRHHESCPRTSSPRRWAICGTNGTSCRSILATAACRSTTTRPSS